MFIILSACRINLTKFKVGNTDQCFDQCMNITRSNRTKVFIMFSTKQNNFARQNSNANLEQIQVIDSDTFYTISTYFI